MLDRSRVGLAVGVSAIAFALGASALAQERLVVAGFGGSFESILREKILPKFEAENNVKVIYVAGNSSDTLAKLQAQKGRQEIDVAFIDDLPMAKAVRLGLCAAITDVNFSRLYESAVLGGGKAVVYGTFATGLVYNTKIFKENGWAAPTSWNDLKNPKYKGKVVIPPISNGYGMLTLVMLSRVNGGNEKNIDVGFDIMKNEVNPNVLAYEASPAKQSELFQTGQVVFGVWGSSRVQILANTGFPVDFVYPQDGSPVMGSAVCPVAKATVSPLAQAFIKMMVSDEAQKVLANDAGLGPSVKDVTIEKPGMMPYGDKMKHAVKVDYGTINEKWQGEWTNRWNREIER